MWSGRLIFDSPCGPEMQNGPLDLPPRLPARWLNRNVVAIGLADLMADFNYEMVLAVLPLFLTIGLGSPAFAVGVVEGVADGSSAAVRVFSGWYSDRVAWRKRLASAGYAGTAVGMGLMAAVVAWPQAVVARGLAWVGRGLRQPIRSAMLAGSVPPPDLGKAFGFHDGMDTLGALLGPAVAFWLLSAGHGFRTVFLVAIVPGVLAFLLFSLLPRDLRRAPAGDRPLRQPLPAGLWRLMLVVAVFGIGNFAPAFFTLRAAEMLQPQLTSTAAVPAAVAFYLLANGIGSAASFPAGWLVDVIGKAPVLALGYLAFAAACVAGIAGHGLLGAAVMAVPWGIHAPLVTATEGSFTSSLVPRDIQGTAFGLLGAVNGVGDLLSSLVVGALWTWRGAPVGLTFGASLAVVATALLLFVRPQDAR